jgi:hypothetical protein
LVASESNLGCLGVRSSNAPLIVAMLASRADKIKDNSKLDAGPDFL